MPTCSAAALTEFASSIIRATGADDDVADEVGRHLVRSNLSGHDSHGVLRLQQYVAQVDEAQIVPSARPEVVTDNGVTGLIDAHRCFGQYSTAFALDWALERARLHGMASVAVRHSAHIGRLGEYTERAADQGLVALVTVGAAGKGVGWMPPFGGRDRFVGANPWSIAVPGESHSFVFDGSMTNIARGKVDVAHARGTQLPPGCIVDRDGRPAQQPEAFFADGSLMPLGGEVAGHKGYALGLASALIGGLAMIGDQDATLIGGDIFWDRSESTSFLAGVFLILIDPKAFGGADDYRSSVERVLADAKATEPASGMTDVQIPGEFETQNRQRLEVSGITLPEPTWDSLRTVAGRFAVPMPKCG
jgi:hydroxycarboxylate dehydrogenase B